MTSKTATYEQWIAEVNKLIGDRLGGCGTEDSPDLCFTRGWYDDGWTAKQAANDFVTTQLEDAGFDDEATPED
jgi:hypothetical protein